VNGSRRRQRHSLGRIELHCPGTLSVKGAKRNLSGPEAMNIAHPAFPENLPKAPLILGFDHAPEGVQGGWSGMPYKLYADGAQIREGVLDGSGQFMIDHEVVTRAYKLELANGAVYDIPVANHYTNPAQGEPANRGFVSHIPGPSPDGGATAPIASAREDHLNELTGQADSEGETA